MDGNSWILIVDDDDGVRSLMATVLGLAGFSVVCAADANDAITHCTERGSVPSLLLCDVILHPAFSGRDLTRHLRLIYGDVKVLYVSGMVEADLINEEIIGGSAAFLAKPFSPRHLVEKVRLTIGQMAEGAATLGS